MRVVPRQEEVNKVKHHFHDLKKEIMELEKQVVFLHGASSTDGTFWANASSDDIEATAITLEQILRRYQGGIERAEKYKARLFRKLENPYHREPTPEVEEAVTEEQ